MLSKVMLYSTIKNIKTLEKRNMITYRCFAIFTETNTLAYDHNPGTTLYLVE